jgi:hypothetical protein
MRLIDIGDSGTFADSAGAAWSPGPLHCPLEKIAYPEQLLEKLVTYDSWELWE